MTNILGPQAGNQVTTRPARAAGYGVTNTWHRPCSAPGANDGTVADADMFNDMLAQLRTAFSGTGITADNGDDMLLRAIQSVRDYHIIDTVISKTVHGVGADFVDLAAAFSWFSQYIVTSTGFVYFDVPAGQYTYAQSVLLTHPTLDRCAIRCAAMAGAVPVPADFSYTGGIASDRVANLAMLRSRFATEIAFTGGNGFLIAGRAGFAISNMLVTGDGTNTSANGIGLQINGGWTSLTNVVSFGHYANCINVYHGLVANHGLVAGCGSYMANGISCLNSLWVQAAALYAYGNVQNGFNIISGAVMPGTPATKVVGNGNGGSGMYSAGGATFTIAMAADFSGNAFNGVEVYQAQASLASATTLNGNGNAGLKASFGSATAQSAVFSGNAVSSIRADSGSVVDAASATGVSGTSSPAINTLGNNNSLIIN